ncbi:MAG: TlpA disulfide reductase family protein [Balneolaceae bacterium]|nr:TlpA disulfide reductase family protein [Balneolaceae bacterium]
MTTFDTEKNSNQESKNKWFSRRDVIEWGVILAVGLILYTTGLHTEVLGRLQQVVLWTGLMQPDTEVALSEQQATSLDVDLITLDGDPANLSDFKGKVIFLNYWATWCPPCIAEMPNIQALYEQFNSNNQIAFAMISMDEDPEKAQRFIERKDFTFPVYHLAGPRPPELRSTLLPTTFVINKNAQILVKKRGMAHYNTSDFRSFLDSLITVQ